jgi:predicted transcriptional regulator
MNINADNNTFEDNNATTESLENIKDKNSEENLVKDLKDSLRESVDQSQNTLNSLMQEIQEKVEDESIKEETKKIINLLSENILNFTKINIDETGFSENLEQSNLEEE